MTTAHVIWKKDWSAAPFLDPAKCRHPGPAVMAIGLTVERIRPGGPGRIAMKASLCMLCGTDSSGQMTADDALEAAWIEHGWHRSTGERLLELTRQQPGGDT